MAYWLISILIAYLLGSIPVGLLLARTQSIDIRQHGSRNIGATNVGRVLGKPLGRLCLALDILKGAAPTLTPSLLAPTFDAPLPSDSTTITWLWLFTAAAAVLGHVFPLYLRFKGGKGVATGLGAMLAVYPILTTAAVIALVVFLIARALTRYVGVSSCLAALSLPTTTALLPLFAPHLTYSQLLPYLTITTLLALVVLIRHRSNLARTLAGTEPKI